MRIVYLGTPDFSVEPLKRIVEGGKHQVIAVVCNKDKRLILISLIFPFS